MLTPCYTVLSSGINDPISISDARRFHEGIGERLAAASETLAQLKPACPEANNVLKGFFIQY